MKKTELLHGEISAVIAQMGHTQTLTISDSGLPIQGAAKRIDLALRRGVPGILETLDTVLTEMAVEKVIFAEEIKLQSPTIHRAMLTRLQGIPVDYVSHETFKGMTQQSFAVIRTGEYTAYANVILVSGTVF